MEATIVLKTLYVMAAFRTFGGFLHVGIFHTVPRQQYSLDTVSRLP
jgi:hypothetical protein